MPDDAHSFGLPLLPLTICLIGGIVAGNAFPDYRVIALYACGASLIWVGFRRYRRQAALFSPLFLFLTLGYLLIQPWAAPRFSSDHVTRFIDKGTYEIIGDVDGFPQLNRHGQVITLNTNRLIQNAEHFVHGKLRVSVSGDTPPLFPGDSIRLRGSLRSIRNFNNPGGFDYKRYLAEQGIWVSTFAKADALSMMNDEPEEKRCRYLSTLRRPLSEFISRAVGERTVGLFSALLLGDMGRLPEDVRTAFQRAGIGHVLSISGLHVGIVGGAAFFLAYRCLVLLPWVIRRGWVKGAAALFSLSIVWIYGILSGMAPATQRSVFMISAFYGALLLGKRHIMINAIAIAAGVIFIYDPPSLFSISCQLSFAAVIAIVICISLVPNQRNEDISWRTKAWRMIVSSAIVTLGASLATLPLVMHYFHEVSTIGLISNLLFIPLIEMCVIPLGLLSLSLSPISPLLAGWVLFPADKILEISLKLVEKMAAWPFASIITVSLSPIEVGCCYYLLFLFVLFRMQMKKPFKAIVGSDWILIYNRTKVWMIPAAVMGVLVVLIDVGYWCYERCYHKDLRVSILDVGQGTANLLELPEGKTLLIDGGGFSDNSTFDVGKNIVAPYLLRKKILSVDEIILSHPDSDHLNGLIYIVENFNVKRLRANHQIVDTEGYRRLTDVIRSKRIYFPEFITPESEEINGVTVALLYPPKDFADRKESWRTTNNNSIVVRAVFGRHSLLFPADIGGDAEEELERFIGDSLKSDVLIAPHHGSRKSSTTAFLEKVKPTIIIVSSGPQKPLSPEISRRYESVCKSMYWTGRDGAVLVFTDGQEMKVRTTVKNSIDEF